MGRKLEVYPACIDCMWRDFHCGTVYASSGAYEVEICDKAPVCKRIVGQRKVEPDDSTEMAESEITELVE